MAKRFRKQTIQILLIVLLILGLLLPRFLSFQPNFIRARAEEAEKKYADPAKKVKDHEVIRQLQQQGIDPEGVEMFQDYASSYDVSGNKVEGKSPYARFYKDLNSDKKFMEVSGLPMVDGDGAAVDVGWQQQGEKFTEKNNLFKAVVDGVDVEIKVKNDQPDGRKENDKLTFHAQLFLNGAEQTPTSPVLLAVDPVNSNYQNNVLEWDYGIVKRRLRIIEGKMLGSWVFTSNPNGEVKIKYNQTGDYKLKLGQYAADDDTEVVPASVFVSATYPFEVSDSATYYPDAHTETTSVDGMVQYAKSIHPGITWANLIAGSGGGVAGADDSAVGAGTDGGHYGPMSIREDDENTNTYHRLVRGIYIFDSSGLPDAATVSAATLSIYGVAKSDQIGITPNINIYTSTPASNTALAAGDYTQIGTTAQSTAITYAAWSTTGYNDFVLNDLTKINLTGVSKFGARNANYDVAAVQPTWKGLDTDDASYLAGYYAEKGTGYQPKLVVTYTSNTSPTNDSLTFTNPYTGGSNNVVADDTTEWNFRAVVSDANGYANLTTVVLRLANSSDNTTPFDSLKFTWTEATDAFSETADTQSAATITSTGSDSSCATNTCTLDFKIKFNSSFSTQSTNYGAELYTTDDAAATDSDSYASFYQVVPISITISSPSDVSLGTITGTGTSSTGEATWAITTNNPAGYKLEWQASTATMANSYSDTIAAYTPAVADTPETWSVASSASEWGGRLKSTSTDYSSATWGTDDSSNAKWLNVKSSALFQIASRASTATGSDEIVQFKAEVGSSKFQPTGTYTVNVTVTATTL